MDLSWAKETEGIPGFVLDADDDAVWLLFPDVGDDYVGEGRFHPISKEQIVFFFGALAFVIEGFWDFFSYPGIRGFFFILAGAFGMVSCILQERDEYMSSIFKSISAHLYALEAIGLLVNRHTHYHLKHVVRTADILFVVSTTMDTVLSYVHVLGKGRNLAIPKTEVAASSLWLATAIIYVAVTFCAKRHGFFEPAALAELEKEEEESSSSDDDGSTKNGNVAPNDETRIPDAVEIARGD